MTTQESRTSSYSLGAADRLELDPQYGRLRDGGTLARVRMPYGGEAWLATRYEDVRAVLADPRFSLAATVGRDVPRVLPLVEISSHLLSMDPPEHTRLRRLVAGAFTNRRVEQLRPRAQQIVDDLLDRILEQGPPVDLVEGLAEPLPIMMICELLGIPFQDRERFRGWSEAVMATTAYRPHEVALAVEELKAYLAEQVARRRQRPTDDLLGALVAARDEQDRLDEEELVMFGVTLLVAGYETTVTQIGTFIYNLLTHPDQLERLRIEPDLLPTAVEELLRFTPQSSSAGRSRVALEAVEVGGVLVRAGETVVHQRSAANRDGTVFERPEELDLGRKHNPHVSFGHGPHHCLGAQLARMELQVAIGSLLERLPKLRFAVPVAEVSFKRGGLFRALYSLPVTW